MKEIITTEEELTHLLQLVLQMFFKRIEINDVLRFVEPYYREELRALLQADQDNLSEIQTYLLNKLYTRP